MFLQEQHEDAETNLYKEYVEKRGRYDSVSGEPGGGGGGGGGQGGGAGGARVGGPSRLALGALNAVNVISQPDGEQAARVAFV